MRYHKFKRNPIWSVAYSPFLEPTSGHTCTISVWRQSRFKGTSPPPETMHLKTLFYWKLRRTQYFVSTQTELRTATQTEPGPFPHALVYKYGHYEASFPKHFISITLFLQAHIVMFIYLFVCLLLVYFMEATLLCSILPFFAGNP